MPTNQIDRPTLTRSTFRLLKHYIMRQREKRKQVELEQECAKEKVRKERELKKRREEEHNLSLEQISKQIVEQKSKLDKLQKRKSELFAELRRVIQQDTRKRPSEMEAIRQMPPFPTHNAPAAAAGSLPLPTHAVYLSGAGSGSAAVQPTMFQPRSQPLLAGMPSGRSPSPPMQSSSSNTPFHTYKDSTVGKVPTSYKASSTSHSNRSVPYPQPPRKSGFGYGIPPVSKPNTTHSSNQSAFTSYPSHYAQHRKDLPSGYPSAAAPQQAQAQTQGRRHAGEFPALGFKTEPGSRAEDSMKPMTASSAPGLLPSGGRVVHPHQAHHALSKPSSVPYRASYPSSAQPPSASARPPAVRPPTSAQQQYPLPGHGVFHTRPPSSGYY